VAGPPPGLPHPHPPTPPEGRGKHPRNAPETLPGSLARRWKYGKYWKYGWPLLSLHLARALLAEADHLLLDEPLAALDPETRVEVLRCLAERGESVLATGWG